MSKKNENGSNNMKTGSRIIVGGLIFQLLCFGFFVLVAFLFDVSVRRRRHSDPILSIYHWYKHLLVLYGASALIIVRNLFRVVEYVQGTDGYLLEHEWSLYIFDAILMLMLMVAFNLVHPSEVNAMLRGGRFANRMFQLKEVKKDHVEA